MVTSQVYGDVTAKWLLQEFIFASTGSNSVTNHTNENSKYFCAPVVHPVTGETITQYKISRQILYCKDYGAELGANNLTTWHVAMN